MNTSTIVAFGKGRKNIIVEITVGALKTTYIGVARYKSEINLPGTFFDTAADTNKAIWNIYKIEEDTSTPGTKIMTISSPVDANDVGTDKFDQIWDDYDSLDYL